MWSEGEKEDGTPDLGSAKGQAQLPQERGVAVPKISQPRAGRGRIGSEHKSCAPPESAREICSERKTRGEGTRSSQAFPEVRETLRSCIGPSEGECECGRVEGTAENSLCETRMTEMLEDDWTKEKEMGREERSTW
jgi:hypothetical protein